MKFLFSILRLFSPEIAHSISLNGLKIVHNLGLINFFTSGLDETNVLKIHLINSIPYFRFLMMGVGLLLIMRYRPKGILPEKIKET